MERSNVSEVNNLNDRFGSLSDTEKNALVIEGFAVGITGSRIYPYPIRTPAYWASVDGMSAGLDCRTLQQYESLHGNKSASEVIDELYRSINETGLESRIMTQWEGEYSAEELLFTIRQCRTISSEDPDFASDYKIEIAAISEIPETMLDEIALVLEYKAATQITANDLHTQIKDGIEGADNAIDAALTKAIEVGFVPQMETPEARREHREALKEILLKSLDTVI